MGRVESLMLGSVSAQVVQGVDWIPVWVIGGEILSSKMLLAVDASPTSRQAVVYAAPYAAQDRGGSHPLARGAQILPRMEPVFDLGRGRNRDRAS